jgi:hypothetical protein
MVEAIPNCRESALFTPAEKAALRLADGMAGNSQASLCGVAEILQRETDRSARLEDRHLVP